MPGKSKRESQAALYTSPDPTLSLPEGWKDMFELDGIPYLLSVDYYSKWITVTKLDYTRSCDIIKAVDEQFANFGVPEEVISDNGP